MSDCLIPAFINDIPTIDALPSFPIVCPVVFPPALAIPDIPLPPCVDGVNVTGGGIVVNVVMGSVSSSPTGSGNISVTSTQCSFDIGGTISLSIPSGGGGGGGGGGGVGCEQTAPGYIRIKDQIGDCVTVTGCDQPGKFSNVFAQAVYLPCSTTTGKSDAMVALDATGIYVQLGGTGKETTIDSNGIFVSTGATAPNGTLIGTRNITLATDVTSPTSGLYLSDTTVNLVNSAINFTAGTSGVFILDTTGHGGQVSIDPSILPSSTNNMSIKVIAVCASGAPKSAYVIMSDPF